MLSEKESYFKGWLHGCCMGGYTPDPRQCVVEAYEAGIAAGKANRKRQIEESERYSSALKPIRPGAVIGKDFDSVIQCVMSLQQQIDEFRDDK